MKRYKAVLFAFLIGMLFFVAVNYILVLKEKYALKIQLSALENEKQNLLQELGKEKELNLKITQDKVRLKSNLRASNDRLNRLFTEFGKAEEKIGQLNSQASLLKAENTALRQEKDKINTQLVEVTQEKDSLKAKLGSLQELREAIRELKRKRRSAGSTPIPGNRGYILKDGKPTTSAEKVKIEVIPLPAKEQ